MATDAYLHRDPTTQLAQPVTFDVTSPGGGNGGKGVATDPTTGMIDQSMIPGESGPSAVASENIAAGAPVNFFLTGGVLKVRNADASVAAAAKRSHGYCLAAFTTGQTATVYTEPGGVVTGLSALTIGTEYFLDDAAPGGFTSTAPSTPGHLIQSGGVALSTTTLEYNGAIIGLA